MTQALSTRSIFYYAALAVPLSFAGIPIYLIAPDFYATEHGVSLGLLGALLLGLRIIDAVQDPYIGRISDHLSAHRGLIILWALLGLVIGFTMVFHRPPAINGPVWFAASVFLATTCFSTLSINLNALGGLWPKTDEQRTQVSVVREGMGMIGLLLAVSLPSLTSPYVTVQASYTILCLSLAAIACATSALFWFWWRTDGAAITRPSSLTPLKTQLPRPIRQFFVILGMSILASSIPAILVVFFVRDLLGAPLYTGLFLGLYFLSALIGLPMWMAVSSKIGKMRAWLWSMVLAIFVFSWAFTLGSGDIWGFAIICILSGIAFGADLSLPPAQLGDLIQRVHVTASASWIFGLYAFLGKAVLAVASGLVLPALEMAGFQPAQSNSAHSLWALSAAYAALPCGLKIFASILLYRSIQNEEHADAL